MFCQPGDSQITRIDYLVKPHEITDNLRNQSEDIYEI